MKRERSDWFDTGENQGDLRSLFLGAVDLFVAHCAERQDESIPPPEVIRSVIRILKRSLERWDTIEARQCVLDAFRGRKFFFKYSLSPAPSLLDPVLFVDYAPHEWKPELFEAVAQHAVMGSGKEKAKQEGWYTVLAEIASDENIRRDPYFGEALYDFVKPYFGKLSSIGRGDLFTLAKNERFAQLMLGHYKEDIEGLPHHRLRPDNFPAQQYALALPRLDHEVVQWIVSCCTTREILKEALRRGGSQSALFSSTTSITPDSLRVHLEYNNVWSPRDLFDKVIRCEFLRPHRPQALFVLADFGVLQKLGRDEMIRIMAIPEIEGRMEFGDALGALLSLGYDITREITSPGTHLGVCENLYRINKLTFAKFGKEPKQRVRVALACFARVCPKMPRDVRILILQHAFCRQF